MMAKEMADYGVWGLSMWVRARLKFLKLTFS